MLYRNIAVLSGHTVYPYLDYGEYGRDMHWITYLREPAEVLVSSYVHQFTSNQATHGKFRLDFAEWCRVFPRRNRQTKWIAGCQSFETAKQILREKFRFVGLVERFDEGLLVMRNELGLPDLDLRYRPKMITRDQALKKQLLNDPGIKELIGGLVDLDQPLYDYVQDELYPTYVEKYLETQNLCQDVIEFQSKCEKYHESSLNAGLWAYRLKNRLLYKPFIRIERHLR